MRILPLGFLFVGTCLSFAWTASAFAVHDEYSSLLGTGQHSDCKCENGKCVTDNRGKQKCLCQPKYELQTEGVCKECYCGRNGKCFFQRNINVFLKRCLCDKGYAEKDGSCHDCQCGVNSKCEFEGENKICYCLEGYADLNGVCTECDCGDFGECEFRNGKKHCLCYEKYLEHRGKCEECDCGNGDCSFQGDNKVCKCNPGHSLKGGRCEACDCGPNSRSCNFDGQGRKVCGCQDGYSQKFGRCEACNCGTNSVNCRYNDGGNKVCGCKQGFAQNNEICEACSCGGKTRTCVFTGGRKVCTCLDGYTPKNDVCTAKCQDNRDCKHDGSCVGEEGKKTCNCKKGLSGDNCEIIEGCKKIGPSCHASGGVCKYDSQREQAYCDCPQQKPYNPVSQKCEGCDCGGNSESCKFDFQGNKVCTCRRGFAQKGETCLQCNCGANAVSCAFARDGNQVCGCKQGFAQKNQLCTAICTRDDECKHNSKCVSDGSNRPKFCKCKKGLTGDNCDIIIDCRNGLDSVCRNGGGVCKYNPLTEKAYCECPAGKSFNPGSKRCEVCSCGENSVSCSFAEDGNEICRCKPGYAQRGKNTCAVSCNRDEDCKNGGKCVGEGRYGAKFCKCGPGLKGDRCEIITDCTREFELMCIGARATCSYDVKKQKPYCKCPEKQVFNPYSRLCEAGPCKPSTCFGGRCQKIEDQLLCICPEGYRLEGIGCFGIQCKQTKCYGGVCRVVNNEEICTCYDGYVLDVKNDVCVLDFLKPKL